MLDIIQVDRSITVTAAELHTLTTTSVATLHLLRHTADRMPPWAKTYTSWVVRRNEVLYHVGRAYGIRMPNNHALRQVVVIDWIKVAPYAYAIHVSLVKEAPNDDETA